MDISKELQNKNFEGCAHDTTSALWESMDKVAEDIILQYWKFATSSNGEKLYLGICPEFFEDNLKENYDGDWSCLYNILLNGLDNKLSYLLGDKDNMHIAVGLIEGYLNSIEKDKYGKDIFNEFREEYKEWYNRVLNN